MRAVDPELVDVLLALYLLTDGDVNDSVPVAQLRVEAAISAVRVDTVVVALIGEGLATVAPIHGTPWISLTEGAVQVMFLDAS